MKFFLILFIIYSLAVQAYSVQWCEKDIYEAQYHNHTSEVEVLVIWFPVRAGSHNVLELCSNHTGLPMQRHCSLNRHGTNATWDVVDKQTKLINCSIIAQQCMEEPFNHIYVMKKNVEKPHTNMWQSARVGEEVQLKEPCLLVNGLPLTRKCLYEPESYTAYWEPIEGNAKFQNVKCLLEIDQKIITYHLNDVFFDLNEKPLLQDSDRIKAANEVINLLGKTNTKRISADIEITTNILEVMTQEEKTPDIIDKVVNIMDLLMKSDAISVRTSAELNAPNRLIQNVEKYFDNMANLMVPTSQCSEIEHGVKYISTNMTSLFVINPFCSNISGIAIYSLNIAISEQRPTGLFYDSNTNLFMKFLYLNQSLEELMTQSHLQVATYFPQELWDKILVETAGKTNIEAVRFTTYKNGYFFVDQNNTGNKPEGIVLAISLPNFSGNLPADLPFILGKSPEHNQDHLTCGYFDYHYWNNTGVITSPIHTNNLTVCQTSHLTHFGTLLGFDTKVFDIANAAVLSVMDESVLDIISIIGCGLSLFGLMCIWLTAICFKKWRSQPSNRVLLNLCFVLTLIMAFFIFINLTDIRNSLIDIKNKWHCIGMGAVLQYIVLVLFSWMLIVAILQYQRYVIVMGISRPTNYILKYAVAAYGLPIIPTASVVYFDPNSYIPPSLGNATNETNSICYPSGNSLYLSVLLPISIIILANVAIFLYIICSIKTSLAKFRTNSDRKSILTQVKVSILLFFLLGVSWIFGLLAHLYENMIFAFLFCLTSTLQGFVLFIYFILVDKNLRNSWIKFCCARSYSTMEDMSSMTPLTTLTRSQKSRE